jgi:hypothetical protein
LSPRARLLAVGFGLSLAVGGSVAFVACVDGTTPNCSGDAAATCGPDLGDGAPPPLDAPSDTIISDSPAVDAPVDAPGQDTGVDAGNDAADAKAG